MIKKLLFLFFLTTSILGFGQTDFSKIDQQSKTIPDTLIDFREIAEYLTNGLETDAEKARAIYIWIAHNFAYDLMLKNPVKRYCSEQELVNLVLKDRKGVCFHYSMLFHAMSTSVGLQSYLICGYTQNGFGVIADISHAWNGIRIGSDYSLIDVTWAAGYVENRKFVHKFQDGYFCIPSKVFIKSHVPFDPIWQFMDNPIDNNDFVSKNFAKLDIKGNYSFEDSIKQYEISSELSQLKNSNRRIIANGVINELVQGQVDENALRIAYKEHDLALNTLNRGIGSYNLFITCKNRQFRKPKLSDSQLRELIDNAEKDIYAANDYFKGFSSSDSELNRLAIQTRKKMPDIISGLEKEKDFVVRYLKIWKPLRAFRFSVYL